MPALRTPRQRLLSTLTLSACAILACTGLARAEDPDDWSLGFGGGWNSYMEVYQGPNLELATTQLDRIASVLQLDETQREEMMSLFYGLEDEHLRAWVKFAESNGDMQTKTMTGKADWAEIQKDQKAVQEEYQAEQDRLVALMLDDLRLLITSEQEARWETIERERRRMDTLTRFGCYPSERFDLVEALGTLDLDDRDRERLEPLIERYADEMDPALVARNRALDKAAASYQQHTERQQEMWAMDWSDPEQAMQAQNIQEELNKLQRDAVSDALSAKPACKRVADLNERYAAEAKEMLRDRDRRELEKMIEKGASDTGQMFDFTNYSRARQKFTMVLNMEEMLGAYKSFSSSMGGGEEWGIMRIAREVEPLTPKQLRDVEALENEFETEMEILETKKPGAAQAPEDAMKWNFTLRTSAGDMTLTHNDPPEGAGTDAKSAFMIAGGGAFMTQDGGAEEEMQEYMAERAELEQRYIERLREMLTLRQRALSAMQ